VGDARCVGAGGSSDAMLVRGGRDGRRVHSFPCTRSLTHAVDSPAATHARAEGSGVAGSMVAGASAQLVGGFLFTPIDIIKERMQVCAKCACMCARTHVFITIIIIIL